MSLEIKIDELEMNLRQEETDLQIEKKSACNNQVNNIYHILKPNFIIVFNSYQLIVLDNYRFNGITNRKAEG